MGANNGTYVFVRGIPGPMEIIGHHVEPIDQTFQCDDIKMLQIPVRGGQSNTEAIFVPRASKSISQVLQEGDVILEVIRSTASLRRDWVLPVWNTLRCVLVTIKPRRGVNAQAAYQSISTPSNP